MSSCIKMKNIFSLFTFYLIACFFAPDAYVRILLTTPLSHTICGPVQSHSGPVTGHTFLHAIELGKVSESNLSETTLSISPNPLIP